MKRIYIIGAGFTGQTIAHELKIKRIFGKVVAFLDDDADKIGRKIDSIPILGPIEAVAELLKKTPADEAIIAIPGGTPEQLKRIYTVLKKAGFVTIRIVPSISQILGGEAHLIQAREINVDDFLTRKPIAINLKESLGYVKGKRVLVTGAGGSIGSDLCRQLLSGGAMRLYILGHGENSIYEIEKELKILQEEGVGEKATIVPVIGDMQDRDFMFYILGRLQAEVVLHTAAHKHVPLLENNPVEAIKNNVFGTKNLVDASVASNVKRFVMLSTDKAVEPNGIYGASKYLAEEIVLHEGGYGRNYMVVRFGNVLGSRGSIVPLFKSQIFKGGPVTVTHPDVKRFFMTIPEAASLVLHAGGVGEDGMLYLLDMGEPMRIQDLAEQMISFYGYEPGKEIEIVYTGLRPGEKLSEKLWENTEIPVQTEHPKLLKLEHQKFFNGNLYGLIEKLRPICFLDRSQPSVYRSSDTLRRILQQYIPTLTVPDTHLEQSRESRREPVLSIGT